MPLVSQLSKRKTKRKVREKGSKIVQGKPREKGGYPLDLEQLWSFGEFQPRNFELVSVFRSLNPLGNFLFIYGFSFLGDRLRKFVFDNFRDFKCSSSWDFDFWKGFGSFNPQGNLFFLLVLNSYELDDSILGFLGDYLGILCS